MYDEKKDKLIKLFELDKGKTTILFKILSYDNNQPKLSISSMYEKFDKTTGYGKVSRLGKEELDFLSNILPEVQDIINNHKVDE
jgi:hypothetical protein